MIKEMDVKKKNIFYSKFLKKYSFDNSAISHKHDAIILPFRGLISPSLANRNVFPDSAISIKKILSKNNVDVNFYDDGKKKEGLVQRGADEIFPFLLFLSHPALTIYLNILSNMIYNALIKKNKGKKEKTKIRVDYAILDKETNIIKWQSIEGKASEVIKVLESDPYYNKINDLILPTSQANDIQHYYVQEVESSKQKGEELLNEVRVLYKNGLRQPAKNLYKKCLKKIREAYLYDQDNTIIRRRLHEIGKEYHDYFKCKFEFSEDQYWTDCPVYLSHYKGGYSIGGIGKRICSICDLDIWECEHESGKLYDNIIARKKDGICTICRKRNCEHIEGKSYNGVKPFRFLTDLKLDHIAYVENPADPLCSIQSIPLSKEDIVSSLSYEERKDFIFGESVLNCHHCLICNGL